MAPPQGHYTDEVFCGVPMSEYFPVQGHQEPNFNRVRFCRSCKGILVIEMLKLVLSGYPLPRRATDRQVLGHLWGALGADVFPGLVKIRGMFPSIVSHVEQELLRGLSLELGLGDVDAEDAADTETALRAKAKAVMGTQHRETVRGYVATLCAAGEQDSGAWEWVRRLQESRPPAQEPANLGSLIQAVETLVDETEEAHRAARTLVDAEEAHGITKALQAAAAAFGSGSGSGSGSQNTSMAQLRAQEDDVQLARRRLERRDAGLDAKLDDLVERARQGRS